MVSSLGPTAVVPAGQPVRQKRTKQLTLQQEKFLAAYARHGDVRKAMSLAGYRKGYLAHRLLRQTAVRLRLEQIRSRLQAQAGTGLPKETVLRELAAIAFADIGQTCDENGVPLPVNELPVEVRSAVQSYSRTRHGTAVKLYDKLTAIELSMRHLGLLQEQTGSGLTVQITIGTLAPSELDPILQAKAVVPSGNSTEPTD